MKAKEWREMKDLTLKELMVQLDNKRKRLISLSVQHKLSPIKNALELREMRRDIARIKTLMNLKFNQKI